MPSHSQTVSFNLDAEAQLYTDIHGQTNVATIKKIMQQSIDCHKKISEKLGLTPENNFRKLVHVDKSHQDIFDTFQTESALILFLVQEAGGDSDSVCLKEFTAKNSKGQEQKIGRMLQKLMTTECVDELIKKLGMSYTKENFIPHFRELIAKQSGVHISTNPFDLLTPSNHCTFSSCHKVEGEYSLTPLYNAACGESFQAIIFEADNRKSGRMWCWSDCESFFFQGGTYGTLGSMEEQALHQYFKNTFDLTEDGGSINIDYEGHGIYHDGVQNRLTHPSHRSTDVTLDHNPICPKCGTTIDGEPRNDCGDSEYVRGAICPECACGNTCQHGCD